MPGLEHLPLDILFELLEHLELSDVARLGKTCRQLRWFMNDDLLCRRAVEISASYSLEAALARENRISYAEALSRVHARRSAFSRADPFGVEVFHSASQFLYKEGVVCVLNDEGIELHDIFSSQSGSMVLPRDSIRAQILGADPESNHKWELLSYGSHVLVVGLDSKERHEHFLVAIVLNDQLSGVRNIISQNLTTNTRLFVRHDRNYLYYGTHSILGARGHHEWLIQGLRLSAGDDGGAFGEPLHLEDFVGAEIGVTVSFEMHDGYLYALSNQTSFVTEEIDFTSYYKVLRFPLDKPEMAELALSRKLFRRQHEEGPIHDSWTDLSLQGDEMTNKLVIVESRREWKNACPTPTRTFYTTDVKDTYFRRKRTRTNEDDGDAESSPDDEREEDYSWSSENDRNQQFPPGDKFGAALDCTTNAYYSPSEPRTASQVHHEDDSASHDPKAFILARTKFRAYNISCSTFVDLVEDVDCCGPMLNHAAGCLRLRIGSRQPGPLPHSQEQVVRVKDNALDSAIVSRVMVAPPSRDHVIDGPYRYSNIALWPPTAAVAGQDGAHSIMNPHLTVGKGKSTNPSRGFHVSGVSDERCIVYMVKPLRPRSGEDQMGFVVVVAFDPCMIPEQRNGDGDSDRPGNSVVRTRWRRPWKMGGVL